MASKINGVIVGSRKCGTTWLYENFKFDEDLRVSLKVKESGFFTGQTSLNAHSYEGLIPDGEGYAIEVDTSLAYSEQAPINIKKYNPGMKVVIILRDPVEYAVSRYLHSYRKGEVSIADISKSIISEDLIREEMGYGKIIDRYFNVFPRNQILVLPYALLKKDPSRFYWLIKEHFVGTFSKKYVPFLNKVNVARASKNLFITSLLSRLAKTSRSLNLHSIVNWAKRIGFHRLFERELNDKDVASLRGTIESCVKEHYSDSIQLYRDLEAKYEKD